MKKTILLCSVILFSLATTAQNKSDLVIKNACDCINKWDTQDMSYDLLVQKLGVCIASDLITYYDELKKEFGITEDDYTESMSMIGQKLGERLALECPRFMELSLQLMQNDNEFKEKVMEEMEKEDSEKTEVFLGRVEKIKTENGLTGISVSSQDESLYFLWVDKFEGSENFEKNPDSLKGKKVSVAYYEKSFYDSNAKTYVKRKVISKLEVLK